MDQQVSELQLWDPSPKIPTQAYGPIIYNYLQSNYTQANFSDNTAVDSCNQDEDLSAPDWVRNGGFLVLLVVVYASLWGMYIVCEDYFVPALNRLCIEWRIPSDVAGATLMGMGNSAPELFTCAVSVFVVKSSLGTGTAIGSSIFNHLCICGVCAVIAKDGRIELDRRVLLREVMFYALSLLMVIWAIKGSVLGSLTQLKDRNQDNYCLKVPWYGSFMLLVLYAIYVTICAFYKRILDYFGLSAVYHPRSMSMCERLHYVLSGGRVATSMDSEWTVLRGLEEEDSKASPLIPNHPFTRPLRNSPLLAPLDSESQDTYTSFAQTVKPASLHLEKKAPASTKSAIIDEELAEVGILEDDMDEGEGGVLVGDDVDVVLDGGAQIGASDTNNSLRLTSAITRGHGTAFNPRAVSSVSGGGKRAVGSGRYECWLLKYSDFYSKLRISSRKWQLRFFTLDDSGFRYCRSPGGPPEEVRCIDIFQASWISLCNGSQGRGGGGATDNDSISTSSSPTSAHIGSTAIPYSRRSASTEDTNGLSVQSWGGTNDEDAFIFRIRTPSGILTLRALTPEVYRRVTHLLQRRISIYMTFPPSLRASISDLQLSRSAQSTKEAPGPVMATITNLLDDSYHPRGSDDPGIDCTDGHDSYWDELALYYKAEAYISTAAQPTTPSSSLPHRIYAVLQLMISPAHWVAALAAANRIMGKVLRPLKFFIRRTIPYPEYPSGHKKRAAVVSGSDHNGAEASGVHPPQYIVRKNLLVVFVSSIWLAVLSYALTVSLDLVAHAMKVPSAVTGLTVGAIAASFPTFLSSLIVAHQGEGNMAISNAFGSNVFGLLVALGLPWFLSIVFEFEGRPYDRIQDDGIVASAAIALLVLLLFYAMLVMSDFVMYRWMGYFFLTTYFIYVVYALSVTL
jgi:Ca2+/Na+ antiporter